MNFLKSIVIAAFLSINLLSCSTTPVKSNSSPLATKKYLAKIPLVDASNKAGGKGERYYDPNSTGVKLYDTHNHSNSDLGPYFKVSDFSKTGDVGFRYARIDPSIVNCLSRVRETLGKSIFIKSSYRSWAYNDQLISEGKKASKTSFHMSGKATDLTMPGVSTGQFVSAVYANCGCGTAIGIGSGWFHVDTRGRSTRPWGYGVSTTLSRNKARRIHKNTCGGGGTDSNETFSNIMNTASEAINSLGQKIKEVLE